MSKTDQLLKAIRDLKPPTRSGLLKSLSPISEQDLIQLIEQAKAEGLITGEFTLKLTEKGYEKLGEVRKQEKQRKRSADYDLSR